MMRGRLLHRGGARTRTPLRDSASAVAEAAQRTKGERIPRRRKRMRGVTAAGVRRRRGRVPDLAVLVGAVVGALEGQTGEERPVILRTVPVGCWAGREKKQSRFTRDRDTSTSSSLAQPRQGACSQPEVDCGRWQNGGVGAGGAGVFRALTAVRDAALTAVGRDKTRAMLLASTLLDGAERGGREGRGTKWAPRPGGLLVCCRRRRRCRMHMIATLRKQRDGPVRLSARRASYWLP